MKLGRVVIDGSKVKANASKHKGDELPAHAGRREAAEGRSAALAARGRTSRPGRGPALRAELPAELKRREERLKSIAETERSWKSAPAAKAEENKEPQAQQTTPQPKDQYNITDSKSRIMKGPDGFVQTCNTQIAVEPVQQLIAGRTVTQQANDKKQPWPMIEKVKQQSGQRVSEGLADSAYCSEENLRKAPNRANRPKPPLLPGQGAMEADTPLFRCL